jgi:hypothetical protein
MVGNVAPDVEFLCPFCGGMVRAYKEDAAVEHTMPTCPKFIMLPCDLFLTAAREKMQQNVQ